MQLLTWTPDAQLFQKVVIDAIGVGTAAGDGKVNFAGAQGRPTKALISATLAAQRAKGGSVADDDMAWLG